MSERDDFQRTITFGESAISHLRMNEIAAYPRHYELWYTYSAGFNHALNKAVNDILRARGRVSSVELSQIFDEFIAPSRLGERIEEIGGRISTEIDQAIVMLTESLDTSESYRGELNASRSKLTDTADRIGIDRILKDLVAATRRTETSNRRLAEQLTESRRQITELQQGLEAIRFESLTDELTTLANRKHFDHSLVRAIAEAEQTGVPFSLLLTDIDHFKKFNDTYGHQTGDQVLRLVAIGVKQNVKGQDIACRYGGEEFAVILPQTALAAATVVSEHIRHSVMSKELVKRSTGQNLGRITISIGVSMWHPGDTAVDMIERADCALYAAKRGGRNRVRSEADEDVLHNTRVA